jgi:hypothetical protein
MEVKGTAFLARKMMLCQEIGEARTHELLDAYRRANPDFPDSVLATTTMPIEVFLAFNEMLVREIYDGDDQSYWRFGEKSAEWGLTAGPYKNLRASKSVAQFAETARFIYASYFSEGRAEGTVADKGVDLRLLGIPAPHRHVYLEYGIVGYFKRGLELVGARSVTAQRVLGFSMGSADVHYHYTLD